MNTIKINMDEMFKLIGVKEVLLNQAQRRVAQLEAQLKTGKKDAIPASTSDNDS